MADASSKRSGQQGKSRPRARQAAKRDTFPWINSQIIAVADTGDFHRLIATVQAYLPQMNLVNISTAFHRLAKFAASQPEAQAHLCGHHVIKALIASACSALARARAGGAAPSSQALSNITWSLATLQVIDEPLLQAIAVPSAENVVRFKPFELSALLWAYAKLGAADATACSCAQAVFEVAADHIPERVQEFSFRCLVTSIWSFATARHASTSLFKVVATQMLSTVQSANCQELANTAWAFGAAGIHHDKLFLELAKRGAQRVDEFKPQELSNMLWGFAANSFFNSAFFAGAALAARRLDLLPSHLASLLWSLTRVRPRHATTSTGVLSLLPECTRQINTFKPQEIATVALAVAKVFGRSEERERLARGAGGVPQGLAAPLPRQVADFFAAVMPLALPQPRGFSGQSLANLCISFLACRAHGAVVLLAAVGREVMIRITTLETAALLHLLRAFTADLTVLSPPPVLEEACQSVARALFGEMARRVDSLRLRELQALARLCATTTAMNSDLLSEELRGCCCAVATGLAKTPLQSGSLDELLEASGSESLESEEACGGLNIGRSSSERDTITGRERRGAARSGLRLQAGRDEPAAAAAGPQRRRGSAPQAVVEGPDCRFVCKVKNTFLHVECSDTSSNHDESDEETASSNGDKKGNACMADILGPPLQFLPKDIELDELQAYRADYQAFRAGQATGARGEIVDLCQNDPEVPWYGGRADRLVPNVDIAGRQLGLCR